jgi:inner membrane protein
MDTLSHALIGVAVAGLSGHAPALGDPVYVATVLGAEAPDFDIVAQLWGNIAYLKQHRSFSHSLPGIGLWAVMISAGIQLFMPHANFLQTLFWAFAGGMSHVIIDYFNTHGVAILWPFKRDRKSVPLLNVFDPILMILMLSVYAFHIPMFTLAKITIGLVAIYIFARYTLRQRATVMLNRVFKNQGIRRIWVMPSLKHLFYWDFVVETEQNCLNGRLGMFYPKLEIKANLPKQDLSALTLEARKTTLGEFFNLFTPFIYFEENSADDLTKINIYDLRYYADTHFIHSATIVFGQDNALCESYIHSLGRTVKVN